jgi:GH15 family glucan-1,4-alpha-glucosidase
MAAVGTARSPAGTEERRDRYPPIAGQGLISDLQTAALIAKSIWYCCPRFDSPSAFASLLDHNRSGHFQIHGRKQCQHMR